MLPGRTCLGCRVYAVSPPPAPPPDLLLLRLPRLRTPPPWLCTSTSACCAPGPPPGLALPECVLDRGLASGDLDHWTQNSGAYSSQNIRSCLTCTACPGAGARRGRGRGCGGRGGAGGGLRGAGRSGRAGAGRAGPGYTGAPPAGAAAAGAGAGAGRLETGIKKAVRFGKLLLRSHLWLVLNVKYGK